MTILKPRRTHLVVRHRNRPEWQAVEGDSGYPEGEWHHFRIKASHPQEAIREAKQLFRQQQRKSVDCQAQGDE